MALTKAAVEGLRARIVDEPKGTKLPNGCIKTADGIIVVPPSRARDGLRTGRPVGDDDQAVEPTVKSAAREETVATNSVPASPAVQTQESTVMVTFEFAALGNVPSQYSSLGVGDKCIVLGMIPGLSYTPPESTGEDVKTFTVSVSSGEYAYCGLEFTNSRGTRHIILLRV